MSLGLAPGWPLAWPWRNWTDRNRTYRNQTDQNQTDRTDRNRTDRNWTDRSRTDPDRPEPDRPEPDRPTGPDMTGVTYAEQSLTKTKKQNSEDPSGSIPDITAHLIHDKNNSIALSCTVFNVPSAGYNPGWIYWSYEFLFLRARGLRTQRPAQTGPGGQNPAFQRFVPMILCSFLWRFRKTTLENHSSKQMMVYEQITFFYKHRRFSKLFFDRKINFLNGKSISGLKKREKLEKYQN